VITKRTKKKVILPPPPTEATMLRTKNINNNKIIESKHLTVYAYKNPKPDSDPAS
jgi:hypothetical protein